MYHRIKSNMTEEILGDLIAHTAGDTSVVVAAGITMMFDDMLIIPKGTNERTGRIELELVFEVIPDNINNIIKEIRDIILDLGPTSDDEIAWFSSCLITYVTEAEHLSST